MRTDIHRPSAIEPADYEFVGIEHDRIPTFGFTPGLAQCIDAQRKRIQDHMARTGGTYSNHEHGGNCHICGAHCIYTYLFYHAKTNSYIRTGFDCGDKMGMGDPVAFRAYKDATQAYELAKAGKKKAQGILVAAGLDQAWAVYQNMTEKTNACDCGFIKGWHETNCSWYKTPQAQFEERTITDIVNKLVKYGSISDKQTNFLRNLLKQLAERPEKEAKRAAEKAAATDCPEGRHTVTVQVLKTEWKETAFGTTLKMAVKADQGFVLWGTVPSKLERCEKGDRLELTATITKSDRDPKFGFFKRPTAKLLATA